MAARGWRNALFCFPAPLRVRFQRLLPASDDCAVALDSARYRDRTPNASGFPSLARSLRSLVRNFEPAASSVLWRGARERNSRCPLKGGWVFLPAIVDGLDGWPAAGNS